MSVPAHTQTSFENKNHAMKMFLENIIKRFSDLLFSRLDKDVFTTENSVRYTFFAALQESGQFQPVDAILEFPHPDIERGVCAASREGLLSLYPERGGDAAS